MEITAGSTEGITKYHEIKRKTNYVDYLRGVIKD